MAQSSALGEGMNELRIRVRTPGKYIVLFFFFPVALISAAVGVWMDFSEMAARVPALEYRADADGGEKAYFNMPDFLVDLAPDVEGRTSYLKMHASIALDETEAAAAAERLHALQPAVIERVTLFLRELRPEDFEGSEGMQRIKREMARRINLVIAPARVDDVVIEDLVIQ